VFNQQDTGLIKRWQIVLAFDLIADAEYVTRPVHSKTQPENSYPVKTMSIELQGCGTQ
jgi:hypothetical protein